MSQLELFNTKKVGVWHPLPVGQRVTVLKTSLSARPRAGKIVAVAQNGWNRRDGTFTYRVKLNGGLYAMVAQHNLEVKE